ncbi:MAG: hypothetical protein CL607_21330 [Anaerolineaceae bacterium]|nr:hypothetical protein [Anaerolineaceae bacterium]MCA9881423.1 hypothetical protein [Anaerolineae bacterium]MCA9886728.1 hypothetical protein [Anaerolineae bacterium]MCA9891353.1 hypothetical protein [Anaerolineae bacterium]
MKKLAFSIVALILLFVAIPVFAHDDGHTCPHSGATITDLSNCVAHAGTVGHIDNAGVLQGLQAKLAAASNAYDRGQISVAINNLKAFINLVEAQAGKHIDATHAGHMIHHAQHVIDALS